MKAQTGIFCLFACLIFFSACKKDDDEPDGLELSNSVFILNEGNFGSGNASVAYFKRGETIVTHGIFETANARVLGDVLQSMTTSNGMIYLVVNNSGKVEAVDAKTFASVGTATGLGSPRYMLAVNDNKAYITDWTSGKAHILNTSSMTVTGDIQLGSGPEQMVMVNGKVYVSNSGGFGSDSTVSIINTSTDMVEGTIQTGINPNALGIDATGDLWVLCAGSWGDFMDPLDDIAGKLQHFDLPSGTIIAEYTFGQTDHPTKMAMNEAGDALYYLISAPGQMYKMPVSAGTLPSNAFSSQFLYGLGLDPVNNRVYGADAVDFAQDGNVFIWDESGTQLDSLKAGLIPNGFGFN